MHLAETSLIKKYENNIGSSIEDVGGKLPYDRHFLPFLDDEIHNQLVGGDTLDKEIDKRLDARGLTPEAVDAWNHALEEIQEIEQKPAMNITQPEIDAWNLALTFIHNDLEPRVVALEDLTGESCIWKEIVE